MELAHSKKRVSDSECLIVDRSIVHCLGTDQKSREGGMNDRATVT